MVDQPILFQTPKDVDFSKGCKLKSRCKKRKWCDQWQNPGEQKQRKVTTSTSTVIENDFELDLSRRIKPDDSFPPTSSIHQNNLINQQALLRFGAIPVEFTATQQLTLPSRIVGGTTGSHPQLLQSIGGPLPLPSIEFPNLSPPESTTTGNNHNDLGGSGRNLQDKVESMDESDEVHDVDCNGNKLTLWQFLLDLLLNNKHPDLIRWTNNKGEFILIQAEVVARMWGMRKDNNARMNYDKLSRALRYYYQKNIIKKVHGHKFVYQFINLANLIDLVRQSHVQAPKSEQNPQDPSNRALDCITQPNGNNRLALTYPQSTTSTRLVSTASSQSLSDDPSPTQTSFGQHRNNSLARDPNRSILHPLSSLSSSSIRQPHTLPHSEPVGNQPSTLPGDMNLQSLLNVAAAAAAAVNPESEITLPSLPPLSPPPPPVNQLRNGGSLANTNIGDLSRLINDIAASSHGRMPSGSFPIPTNNNLIHPFTPRVNHHPPPVIQQNPGPPTLVLTNDQAMAFRQACANMSSTSQSTNDKQSSCDALSSQDNNRFMPPSLTDLSRSVATKRTSSEMSQLSSTNDDDDPVELCRPKSTHNCCCSCHGNTSVVNPDSSTTKDGSSPAQLHSHRHQVNMQRLTEQLTRFNRLSNGRLLDNNNNNNSEEARSLSTAKRNLIEEPDDGCIWMPVPITMLKSWLQLLTKSFDNDSKSNSNGSSNGNNHANGTNGNKN